MLLWLMVNQRYGCLPTLKFYIWMGAVNNQKTKKDCLTENYSYQSDSLLNFIVKRFCA